MNLENGNEEKAQKAKAGGDQKETENQGLKLESHAAAEENSKIVDASVNQKKKKKKGEVDPKAFVGELFEEINKFRQNPASWADKIKDHMQYIKTKEGKLIYENGDFKTALNKGEDAFKSAIDIVSKTSPLPTFEHSDEYKVEVPDDVEVQAKQHTALFNELKKANQNKNFGFNLDISNPNAEIILLLQLVDDNKNNGNRRNNFLNPNFKTVGISMKKGKGKHWTFYITFAN